MTTDEASTPAQLPPGPSQGSAWRLALAFHRDPLRLFLDLARDHGDIVHTQLGRWHNVLITHPDFAEEVLVKHPRDFTKEHNPARQVTGNGLLVSEGDFHKRERRLLQPAFQREHIARYGDAMADLTYRRRDRWRAGEHLDAHREMMELTQCIVARAFFSTDVEAEANALGEALATALRTNFLTQQLPFIGLVRKLRRRALERHEAALGVINSTLHRMIDEHRKGGGQGDLLSVILQAQDTEGGTGGLSDQQVRDEVATLFVAGHETTANVLSWIWYLLARHPEVEAAVHAELDQVLAGRPPTVADVPHLPYVEMVVAEALRLYPAAWTMLRHAVTDTHIGGYSVPAGTVIFVSVYGIHHDARFFPDPWRFEPQRMTRAARAARPHFVYFPFGGGARQCIGEGFAWMEMALVVATLAQRWRLRLAHDRAIVPEAGITLRPKKGMPMIVEARNS
jgi:cytochrome P450